jgi:PKD repeat protein
MKRVTRVIARILPALVLFGPAPLHAGAPQLLNHWGQLATKNNAYPGGIAVDTDGSVFVANSGPAIDHYSAAGQWIERTVDQFGGPGQLYATPGQMQMGPNGLIYLTQPGADRVAAIDKTGRVKYQWGSSGVSAGQFNGPLGLAVDGAGHVMVSETGNTRIQVFDLSGSFLTSWGAKGTGPGQISAPRRLALTPAGHLLMADTNPNGTIRISEWTWDGTPVNQFATDLYTAVNIAVDSHGRLVATNASNCSVEILSLADGKLLSKWAGVECNTLPGEMAKVDYMALDNADNLWVAEHEWRLAKFSPSGSTLASAWLSGALPGTFTSPAGLAVSPVSGEVLVQDGSHYQLLKHDGTPVRFLFGRDDSGFLIAGAGVPVSVASDAGGNWYLGAFPPSRIEKYDASLNFVNYAGGPGKTVAGPLCAMNDGSLYTLAGGSVVVYDADGAVQRSWGSLPGAGQLFNPVSLACDRTNGLVYVVDAKTMQVDQFDTTGQLKGVLGSPGDVSGQFDAPGAIAVDSRGLVYVADTSNQHRNIQVFDRSGAWQGEFQIANGATAVAMAFDANDHLFLIPMGWWTLDKYLVQEHSPFQPVAVAIQADPPSGTAPLQVKLSAAAPGTNIQSYLWSDANGTRLSSAPQPVVTLTAPGPNKIALVLTTDQGQVAISRTIVVVPHASPDVSITNGPAAPLALGDTWHPQATAVPHDGASVTHWTWKVDDTVVGNAQDPGPLTFSTAGDHMVVVTVTDSIFDAAYAARAGDENLNGRSSAGWRVSVAPEAGSNTRFVIQKGVEPYPGAADTYLDFSAATHGLSPRLGMDRPDNLKPILKFDLSPITGDPLIQKATLRLYNLQAANDTRTLGAYRMLKDWDEGNIDTIVSAPGQHGATSNLAFHYYPGEGTDQAWAGPMLAAGQDYTGMASQAGTPLATAAVTGIGWVSWDVTALVQEWIDGTVPNYGLMLTDVTDSNHSTRWYAAGDSAQVAFRPTLEITIADGVPRAFLTPATFTDARFPSGGTIALDGSQSHAFDQQNHFLTYSWTVTAAPPNSTAGPAQFTPQGSPTTSFTPDKYGTYTIQLTVTDSRMPNAPSTATAQVTVFQTAQHPRLFLTPARLQRLAAAVSDPSNIYLRNTASNGGYADPLMDGIYYNLYKSDPNRYASYAAAGDRIVADALYQVQHPVTTWSDPAAVVWVAALAQDFDLGYDAIAKSSIQVNGMALKDAMIQAMNGVASQEFTPNLNGLTNNNVSPMWVMGLVGIATLGDNPMAERYIESALNTRWQNNIVPFLTNPAAPYGPGGGWPEGPVYAALTGEMLVLFADIVQSGLGRDLFAEDPWFKDRLKWGLLQQFPGVIADPTSPSRRCYDYPSIGGDAERFRCGVMDEARIASEILVDRFWNDPDPDAAQAAAEMQTYLTTPPISHTAWLNPGTQELIFLDPGRNGPPADQVRLAHYAPGAGTVFLRGDRTVDSTWVGLQASGHFAYHQHLNAGAFYIYKDGDLAAKSGVYQGSETADPNSLNWTIQPISENTMLVYDPNENFSNGVNFRAGTGGVNSGGQHPFRTGAEVASVDVWNAFPELDAARIVRFHDEPGAYSYAYADVTNAYSNPNLPDLENQLTHSHKLALFTRELTYLRPHTAGGDDFVVVFDRVRSTDPGFKKTWLLHTANEPKMVNGSEKVVNPNVKTFDGDTAYADNGQGRLFWKVLLPAGPALQKVSGYYVNGQLYPGYSNPWEGADYAIWRIEESPGQAQTDDLFLNVFFPTQNTRADMPPTVKIASDEGLMVGAQVADRVALFAVSPETVSTGFSYTVNAASSLEHVIVDIQPGTAFAVKVVDPSAPSKVLEQQTVQSTADGTISFKTSAKGMCQVQVSPAGRPSPRH